MPAEEGIRLNNEERLFPAAGSPCEQHQEDPIRLGTRWALHLTTKDDQLLPSNAFSAMSSDLVRAKIVQCSHEERASSLVSSHCNKRCRIRLNERWNRRWSRVSTAVTALLAPSKRWVR